MTYDETIEYLYAAAPAFTKVGAAAYKEGLTNTEALDAHAGHPHRSYLTIHVAGTNGKGSCSHSLAAILQEAGLKVGLYTSPHLVTFRERIRVNGGMIPDRYVLEWVERNKEFFEPLSPSFFELTTSMAFEYFRDAGIDIAVVEVGLGGRLDCTNIITPILSVITNISFDHTQFLGDTLAKIAAEKAGIIKPGIPVVIGETTPETRHVFEERANALASPIIFAEEHPIYLDCDYDLHGIYQARNRQTVLNCLVPLARALGRHGINIKNATSTVRHALSSVCKLTGLQGRWQTLGDKPLRICDTGHNVAGWEYLSEQIMQTEAERKKHAGNAAYATRIVFGMVDDKDIDKVLAMLPHDAIYYFTQATTHRAIPASTVKGKADSQGLEGRAYGSVEEAYTAALSDASENDFIYIGGSSYIVADLLTYIERHKPAKS
ncbi:MAG: bifunctional folylpolyglutamate synthase/dihydrofolate synthase [Prevotella sp.]